jgi:ribosome-binding factor A
MNNRILKINELLKEEIGKIILEEIDFEREIFATIIKVDTSKDLSYAKIFISVYPSEKTDEVLKKINGNIYSIQKILDKKLKMRPVPKISFRNLEFV